MFEIFKIKSITVSTVTLQTQEAILYHHYNINLKEVTALDVAFRNLSYFRAARI